MEIRSLLANAQPDGFVAHVTFWQRERFEDLLGTYAIAYRTPYLSDCIQPPVLAEAVAAAARGPNGDSFLAEVLPRVRRYYDWLDSVRDPDRDGLIATLQPDESGLDHTPKYDRYLGVTVPELAGFTAAWERVASPYAEVNREHHAMFSLNRFIVEDVLVNTIYAENQRVLAELILRDRGQRGCGRSGPARGKNSVRAGREVLGRVCRSVLRSVGCGREAASGQHDQLAHAHTAPRSPFVHRRRARSDPFRSPAVRGGIPSAQRRHERTFVLPPCCGQQARLAGPDLDEHELVYCAWTATSRPHRNRTND